jgi:hypothetical protein
MRVVLPDASPDSYLAWMAFWREVEQKMGESPALAEMAGSESAPFLDDETARITAQVFVPLLIAQVTAAKHAGDSSVAPVIDADPDVLRSAIEVIATRGRWLTDERLTAMGLEPLEPKLVNLRNATIEKVRRQIG